MSEPRRPSVPSLARPGEALTWLAGVILAVSAFTGWYSFEGQLFTVSVLGWHTGTLGKLVLFAGLAVLLLLVLGATGLELPAQLPAGGVVAGLGGLATVFVLIRLIDIPDRFAGTGRGIGIWISLLAGLLVVVAGLLKASDEL
ncbi:MAG: hypothetical protein KJ051_09245 [Thermoleophilia bacterium]|nr:hypothetical protein [Thermoleophilia bacterium]